MTHDEMKRQVAVRKGGVVERIDTSVDHVQPATDAELRAGIVLLSAGLGCDDFWRRLWDAAHDEANRNEPVRFLCEYPARPSDAFKT